MEAENSKLLYTASSVQNTKHQKLCQGDESEQLQFQIPLTKEIQYYGM